MRRALLLSLIILLSQPFVSATDISDDTEEDSSGTLSGTYTVSNGATWTVSGDYEIAENTAVIIEEGATMVVSGSMDAVAPPKLNLAGTANVHVPVGFLGETGVLRIDFADEVLYGIDIEINNETTVNWTGTQFDWNGDLDVENITVNITTHPFQISSISTITLSAQGTTPVMLEADELSGDGTSLVIPDRNNAWSIDVQGTLIVTGSIFGAGITCSGTCTLNGAQMTSTGPIEVMGSISVTDSSLSGGISDEDIIIWDDATITWTNSTGTGGVTDNWVNILTTRTVGVQNGYVVFYGYNMGYDSVSTSPLGDNNTFEPENMGDNVIEIALDERDRMIRWQDGSGVVHEESASGLVVLSTPWGNYEHQISELPKVNHFDVSLDLPSLSFDSLVESDNENNVNSRLGVMATVTNNGDAAANFLIDCTSNGADANVGVNVPYSAEAGETIEIPMNWDSAVEGDLSLECTIFVPYHFEGFDVVSSGTATTNPVTWSIEDDDSSNLVLPISIGLVVAVVIFVLMFRRQMSIEAAKEYSHITEEVDDEDSGVIE
tara:strand:+ start:836 stop:2482 length:1647 start_codon:yes stop_codon:yes gene_type:complete